MRIALLPLYGWTQSCSQDAAWLACIDISLSRIN